jgi:hypothetical protein
MLNGVRCRRDLPTRDDALDWVKVIRDHAPSSGRRDGGAWWWRRSR